MKNGNETGSRTCRFLSEDYFSRLYDTFIEAFSDYVFPFALTETQFRNHITLNGVELDWTIGTFEGDRLVGFSLNGFGLWNGKETVYDAGTGVIPAFRRQGISQSMFELMLKEFEGAGHDQFLLEVIATNTGAINLYEKFGFQACRELALLQRDAKVSINHHPPPRVQIRDVNEPDWPLLKSFWDGFPSWQNSVKAVDRSNPQKRIVGAFDNNRCVGYVVFSPKFGRVAQIGVDREYRNQGIGTALIGAMGRETADGFSMQVINIDKSLDETNRFFRNLGFYERLVQHEMILPI